MRWLPVAVLDLRAIYSCALAVDDTLTRPHVRHANVSIMEDNGRLHVRNYAR